MLDLIDLQTGPFLGYRVARRDVEQKEQKLDGMAHFKFSGNFATILYPPNCRVKIYKDLQKWGV